MGENVEARVVTVPVEIMSTSILAELAEAAAAAGYFEVAASLWPLLGQRILRPGFEARRDAAVRQERAQARHAVESAEVEE